MTADLPDGFDPELPILAELEQELQRRLGDLSPPPPRAGAGRAQPAVGRGGRTASPSYRGGRRRGAPATAAARPPQLPPRPRSGRPQHGLLRRGGVVARRSGALVALGLLVGATALATRTFVGGSAAGDPSLRTTAAAQIATGRSHGESWTLSAARRGDDLCDAFFVDGLVATRCDEPPAAGATIVDSLLSARSRYIVGLAAADVRSVTIDVGAVRRTAHARPAASSPAVTRARLPRGLRWFVVRLPRGAGDRERPTVRVTARVRTSSLQKN